MAKRIEEMGADSICIKDMARVYSFPYKATELVTALKEATDLPIQLHTHYTSGVASMTYLKAVEAGVDIIDTAMSPFAMGTSQPATEVMVETFKGTPYDTGLDQNKLAEIADYFRPMRDEALDTGLLNPKNLGVNIKTLLYQVPGGMLLQPDKPVKRAARRGQILRCTRRSTARKKRPRRVPAGYSVFPDRWYPGCIQCPDGRALQDGNERDKRRSCRKIRCNCKTVQSGSTEEMHRRYRADHLPLRRPA